MKSGKSLRLLLSSYVSESQRLSSYDMLTIGMYNVAKALELFMGSLTDETLKVMRERKVKKIEVWHL
jgi:hypothetical protein